MTADTLTAFDAAVLLIVGLSMLFAFSRGFVTVSLSFAAWAGALVATIFGFTLAKPYGRDLISPAELADILVLVALFILSLFLLKSLATFIGGKVKDGPLGMLDRSFGALFGLLRGMVVVSAIFLAFTKIFPGDDEPDWIKGAKTRPLVAWGAGMLEGFAADALGKDPTRLGADYMNRAESSIPSQYITDKLEEQAKSYADEERRKMENLFDDLAPSDAAKDADGAGKKADKTDDGDT
ncbi:CvpA family protein [Yunchengibacter salinarum]|uniref:CvpA family protein n=1 Tax=Yunchengibacter salinarum TaxID=3133399 RepID=UPI0035B6A96B